MNTSLPVFPCVSIAKMRSLEVGEFAMFSCEGRSQTTAAANASRIDGMEFEYKTAAVFDPAAYQSVKVLFVTRKR